MMSRWYQITVHDIYSFGPNLHVELDEFTDIIGRNFRQPEEGLGFDNSPVAHMWRAMIRPIFRLTTLEITQAMLGFLGIADAAAALTTRT